MIYRTLLVRITGLALAITGWLALAAAVPAADPVEDLRQAHALEDVSNPSEAMLQFRRANLQRKIDALKDVGDLRRALVLDSWRDDPARGADLRIRRIDADMRREVAKRFMALLETQARTGPVDSRIAVASLIAELGPSVRALTGEDKRVDEKKIDDKKLDDKTGFARTLLPIVEILIQDKDAGVRQQALRALGNINPDPKKAGPLFGAALKSDPHVGARRVAADGLGQMVRVVNHLHGTSPFTRQVVATRAEAIDVVHECIQKCAIGFQDADAKVRKHSVEALLTGVQVLNELIDDLMDKPLGGAKLPPIDRPLDDKEKLDSEIQKQKLVREIAELQPLLAALRMDVDKLPPLLKDQEGETRLATLDALRHIAISRQRLSQRAQSIPNYAAADKANLELMAGTDPLENFLQKDLDAVAAFFSEPNVQVRKIAALFLFHIEEKALPVSHVLIAALGDRDRSIRWLAARSLAHLPAEQVVAAVPALAKMLGDADVLLRVAAANTLQTMGPQARVAADALAQAVTVGDADGRHAAMLALRSMGRDSAPVAVPKLIEVLGQPDVEVKGLVEACKTLGYYRNAAKSALPALRRLLGHDDSEVRIAASEAILAVNTVTKN